jgi:predicted cation transporter
MLGAVLNSRASARAADLRPGWVAIRRSIIIAIIVGGVIIAVNQLDIVLSGQITPLVWLKIFITPGVPFCVSLYGAYLAYRSALAREQSA